MTKTAIPDDRTLVQLYRRFSDEEYCAGWLSSVESCAETQQDFRAWLRGGVSEHLAPMTDYEQRALPTLRRIYAEVFGADEAPKQLEGRGHHV